MDFVGIMIGNIIVDKKLASVHNFIQNLTAAISLTKHTFALPIILINRVLLPAYSIKTK